MHSQHKTFTKSSFFASFFSEKKFPFTISFKKDRKSRKKNKINVSHDICFANRIYMEISLCYLVMCRVI